MASSPTDTYWPKTGGERAFIARKAAHPEVDASAIRVFMTFEEYSNLFSLSPKEPFGSRLDEYASYFDLCTVGPNDSTMFEMLKEANPGLEGIEFGNLVIRARVEACKKEKQGLDRVATLIGASIFKDFIKQYPGQQGLINMGTVAMYKQYVFLESCAYAWLPHVASNPRRFGPRLRHFSLRKPRFKTEYRDPRFQPGWLDRLLSGQGIGELEAPYQRSDTEEEVDDICVICRVPVEAGETLTCLPCTGPVDHWYHPDCIGAWMDATERQSCVYSCAQRIGPRVNTFDFSFTFDNDERIIHFYDDPDIE